MRIEVALSSELRSYLSPREPLLVARTPLGLENLDETGLIVRVEGTDYSLHLLDRRLAKETTGSALPHLLSRMFRGISRSTASKAGWGDLLR